MRFKMKKGIGAFFVACAALSMLAPNSLAIVKCYYPVPGNGCLYACGCDSNCICICVKIAC